MKRSFKIISQTGDNIILFIGIATFIVLIIAGYIKLLFF